MKQTRVMTISGDSKANPSDCSEHSLIKLNNAYSLGRVKENMIHLKSEAQIEKPFSKKLNWLSIFWLENIEKRLFVSHMERPKLSNMTQLTIDKFKLNYFKKCTQILGKLDRLHPLPAAYGKLHEKTLKYLAHDFDATDGYFT